MLALCTASAASAQLMLMKIGPGSQASGPTGTTYYVDSTSGNDSNNGMSPALAWASFTPVNAHTYNAGDQILFKSGETFAGTLFIQNTNYSGTPPTALQPLVVSTYGGSSSVTFSAGSARCIKMYQIGAYAVSNINCTGTGNPPQIQADSGTIASLLPAISFNNVSVTGASAGGDAMEVGGDVAGSGFNGVTISNSSFTSNTGSHTRGIEFYETGQTTPIHQNVTISNVTVSNNDWDGILMGGVSTGSITNSVVSGNGANCLVCSGIDVYQSSGITVSFNEVYNTQGSTDGEGIDLDGGTQNSIVEYNYTHGNAGGGFTAFQQASEGNWANNIFRYNISQNDAANTTFGSFTLGAAGGSAFTGTNQVYNNTFYQGGSTSTATVGVYPAEGVTSINTFTFSNNIFILTSGAFLFNSHNQGGTPTMTGNDYCPVSTATCSGTFSMNWISTNYSSFASWQTATSQEMVAGANVGLTSWPALTNAGGGGTIGGYNPSNLSAYKLSNGSGMIGTGQSISSPGSQDFYGETIPNGQGTGYNVGADGGTGVPLVPAIDWNFATNTATGCTFGTCLTVARADGGASTDLLPTSASGASYNTFGANTLRLTSGSGLLIEEARTNFLLNSTAPATQTTGSLATGTYVLWVNGSGSATMSSGTATGCGTSAATNGSPVTIVLTVAGTCTVTVSGSLNAFQLEQCTNATNPGFGTSLIITAGSTVARPTDNVELASTALSDFQNSQGWMSMKFEIPTAVATSYTTGSNGVPRLLGSNGNNTRWAVNYAGQGGEFDWTRNTTNLAFPSNKYATGGTFAVGSTSWGPGGLVVTLANQNPGTATEGTDLTFTTVYLGQGIVGGSTPNRALNGYIAHFQLATTQPLNASLQAQTPQ